MKITKITLFFPCFSYELGIVPLEILCLFPLIILKVLMSHLNEFLLAELAYNHPLVTTTPPKRLDGLSSNFQGIFLQVSSCASDKMFKVS